MRRRKHKYLIIILILLFISVGFAYLTSTLDIVGIGHLKKASWNIYFDNVNIVEGNNLSSNPPTTSNHNTTSVSYTVNFTKPGDTYKFYIDIVNNGTIDAMVSLIDENTILTSNQSKYASYSISYIDGTPIQENNFLGRHSKETLQIIIKYKKDVTSSDLPTSQMNLSFNLRLTYKQAKNADNRRGESTLITDLSGNNNHGTLYGGRINADGTVYLDGVDDYINCGLENYDFGNSISYVLRMKTSSVSNMALIALFGNWRGAGGGLYFNNQGATPKYSFQIYGKDIRKYTNFVSNTSVELDTWKTVVGTYDGNSLKMYINGTQIPNNSSVNNMELIDSLKISANPITIGAMITSENAVVEFSNITISDALVFDRALTSEEIATDYASTINPTNTSNMLLRYQFKNTIVKDLSGNGNDGTIYRDPKINSDGTLTTDGIDDYVDCGLNNYTFGSSISLIARVKFHSLNGTDPAILANFQNAGLGLYLKNQYISFTTHKSSWVRYVSTIKPELNKWYTIVGTYNGSVMKLYINGKESLLTGTANVYQVSRTGNLENSKQFLIGADPNNDGSNGEDFSNITVSDILIFDRAVTKDEVINDYSKIISPSNREDLLLYYHFG
ncbi:MAG: LamG domain-containing protein [Bacilli bacterium]|nr:LamG domain-containing protein [Bacilli bacterium]